jgi:hypothetical protein
VRRQVAALQMVPALIVLAPNGACTNHAAEKCCK